MLTIKTTEIAQVKRCPDICWESVNCNLCGQDNAELLHRERLGYFDRQLDFSIVRCRNCGLVYTNPRLADVNEVYLEDPDAGHDQWQRHAAAKQQVFKGALNELCRLVCGSKQNAQNATLLDVGCGSGHFLQQAQQRGFKSRGIEPAKAAVEYAKANGLAVTRGNVFDFDMAGQKFDVITAWDVIEHVNDPLAMLGICADWLKPGGIIGLRFPSANWQQLKALVFHRWLKLTRPAYAPTIHLTFFSETTFAKMAQKVGLQIEKVKTTPAEPNTENFCFDMAKHLSNVIISNVDRVSPWRLGNLEVYCRKVAK